MNTLRNAKLNHKAGAVVTALVYIPLLGCQDDEADVAAGGDMVETIAEEPQRFAGQQVTLVGEVDSIYNSRAFELEGNDWLFDEDVLVVTKSPIRFGTLELEDDDQVIVTGTVRAMTAGIESEIGWHLDPGLQTEWAKRPAIVAEAITGVDEYGTWSEVDQPEGELVGITAVYAIPDPVTLVDQRIRLEAIPVVTKAGDGIWVGYEHATQLFVAPPKDAKLSDIETWELVDVQGTLKAMPPVDEATERWNFDPALRAQIAEEALYLDASKLSETIRDTPPTKQSKVDYATFAADPNKYSDAEVKGEAIVDEVVSDRAFWLKSDEGERVLAIVREDVPKHEMIDINKGQTLKFAGARVVTPKQAGQQISGKLEPETKRLMEGQKAVLAMHWKRVDIEKKGG